jgi:hypothetical protein
MNLKYGFGCTTPDVGIEISCGSMSREQAINLVSVYDGQYPDSSIDDYLDYDQVSQDEFDSKLDKWANQALFDKVSGCWEPKFKVAYNGGIHISRHSNQEKFTMLSIHHQPILLDP